MAAPVVVGVLSIPAIGFLVRFYMALARDYSQHTHRANDLVRAVAPDEVVECRIWRL